MPRKHETQSDTDWEGDSGGEWKEEGSEKGILWSTG